MLPDDTFLSDAESDENKQCLVQKGTEELASRVRARDLTSSHFDETKTPRTSPRHEHELAGVEGVDQHIHTDYVSSKTPCDSNNTNPSAPVLLLLSGSPRCKTCVSLIDIVERGAQESGVRTQRFLLCDKHIDPCIGCGGCNKTGNCVLANRTFRNGNYMDDYLELTALLDNCDGLALVAPVYFSGPTAQLKALFDRFQPYWVRKYLLGMPFPKRRPAQLFVVGAGGDPHGFEPLVTISRSCLQIAGFELEKVGNFVGYRDLHDMPQHLSEEQAKSMNAKELSLAKEAIDKQAEFCRRALDSGRMLGRMVKKSAETKYEHSDLRVGFEHKQSKQGSI